MYRTIDLFAGAGGLSLGFQQSGKFEIVAAAEINKNAKATYCKNISKENSDFQFIDNVLGFDFQKLNEDVGGIDIIIGGPPCQGFSNANRQKSALISMNNGLVKEYFRAVKEIRPLAFVMENVSMLSSKVHRFYDSQKDNRDIEDLIENGAEIPKQHEVIFVAKTFEGLDILNIAKDQNLARLILLPQPLYKLIGIFNKHQNNEDKLKKFLEKQTRVIQNRIDAYVNAMDDPTEMQTLLLTKLENIRQALATNKVDEIQEDIKYVDSLQKALLIILETYENELIGSFELEQDELKYKVDSYSVIDYINAILGDEYVQKGDTLNAEWFGVPQERKRYIVFGVRKDIIKGDKILLPQEPKEHQTVTIGDAILDLQGYAAGYDKEYEAVQYEETENLSIYAQSMRRNSTTVKNHITTQTRQVALDRFKAIAPGQNFHSLSSALKTTYAKPERTQNTIYLRLDATKPSDTVVNVRKSMWIHPVLDRAVTVREAARLQSFPDDFEFVGTKDSQYQQVGNAVPPLLAQAIAKTLFEQI